MAGVGLNDARVGLLDLENGEHRSLFPGSWARYLPSGHLVYYHAGVYLVVPFDVSELRTTGEPIAVTYHNRISRIIANGVLRRLLSEDDTQPRLVLRRDSVGSEMQLKGECGAGRQLFGKPLGIHL